jgi:hypothetical protein
MGGGAEEANAPGITEKCVFHADFGLIIPKSGVLSVPMTKILATALGNLLSRTGNYCKAGVVLHEATFPLLSVIFQDFL